MRILIKNIMIVFNILAGLALIISYLSIYISPVIFWWPAFFGLCFPYLILLNVFFILFWGLQRNLLTLISGIILLLGLNYFNRFFKAFPDISEKPGIDICSYNVKYFRGLDKKIGQRENRINIEIWVQRHRSDIVCLQEIDSASIEDFSPFGKQQTYSTNNENLPKTRLKTDFGNLIIFSKYKIINSGNLHFENTPNMIIYADLLINGDTVRVYNCHLQSYMFASADVRAFNSILKDKSQLIHNYHKLKSTFQNTFIERAYQVDALRKDMNRCPYPMIVCGDFNDTPISYAYRAVKGNMKDAFVESGRGLGFTFPGYLFSFRIDYVMHNSKFSAYNFRIGHVRYSDHFPILCRLEED